MKKKLSAQTRLMLKAAHKAAIARALYLEHWRAIQPTANWFHKAIVCAALRDVADSYVPFHPDGKRDVANLRNF